MDLHHCLEAATGLERDKHTDRFGSVPANIKKKGLLWREGAFMLRRTAIHLTVVILVMAFAGIAQGQDKLQGYLSDAACKVKVTTDPLQKRAILDKSFDKMFKALNTVEGSPLVSKDDKAGIDHFKVILKEKQDELAGINGYDRVPDAQLNAFADYVVQDIEQASQSVTISTVTLLLIIIIVILLV
jgi:hypothetical protein